MGKASKQKQNERRAAKLAGDEPPERVTIKTRDRWGTEHTLTRRNDGRWNGVVRTADDAGHPVSMSFTVSDAVAREWQKNHAEDRDMRATATSRVRS